MITNPTQSASPDRRRAGFTLIELLIVVVIIGVLAAIAIPKFAATKEKAYLAKMKGDLRNLMTAQEGYSADFLTYYGGPVPNALLAYNPSAGVVITIVAARRLNADAFGVMAFAMTTGWLLSVATDAGLSMHLARETARHAAGARRLLVETVSLRAGLAFVAATMAVALAPALVPRHWRVQFVLIVMAQLAGAVVDWLDPDTEQRFPSGGEDIAYTDADPPYRTANSMITSTSELMAIAGFDRDTYRAPARHGAERRHPPFLPRRQFPRSLRLRPAAGRCPCFAHLPHEPSRLGLDHRQS